MGEDGLVQSNEFRQEVERLKTEFMGLARELGASVIPLFTDTLLPLIRDSLMPMFDTLMEKINGVIEWFAGLDEEGQT